MKRKAGIVRIFVAIFAVFGVLLFSTNLVFAQCGNYFKTNYRVITNLNTGYLAEPALDDWTGDGRADFWNFRRNNPNTFTSDIVIYPAKPNGYWDWENPIVYTTTIIQSHSSYQVRDFDSDGRMDLLLGPMGSFQIHRNTGNGSLTASPFLTDSDGSLVSNGNIGFTDLNGDNLLDWLYVLYINGIPSAIPQIRYQLQNPNGSFGNKTIVLQGTTENGVSAPSNALGDFNGDGKLDIVYSNIIGGTNKYVMIKNLGGGNFQVGTPVESNLSIFRSPVIDINNDGRSDILSGSHIFYGQADGTFTSTQLTTTNARLIPAELNGDNNLDVMEISLNYYATHINNGAGSFSRTVYQNQRRFDPSGTFKFEDFSGDGKADVYETRPNNLIVPNNIFGEKIITIKGNVCQSFGETKLANFDGNENADVTMWNPNTGNWSLKNARWSTDADPNTRVFNWGLGSYGDVPAPGDFDGDGKTDYSVYRNSTGVWYIFKSSDSTWLIFSFGLTGDIAVPNDYDGGGKTDIAVFRPADGNWYIWFSETQQFQVLHFGASGDKPVPADYDGDGKTDVAVYRPSEGNWYHLKSSDGNFIVRQWGIETDKPVPADYDGDGRADLTIWRGGTWWILRSSNNSSIAIQFGTANDIPVPIYRNSASADLTFYRPSNNSWYSLDYRNFQGFALGGNGDVPVYFGLPNN